MKTSHWACWTPGKNGWQRSRGTSRRWRCRPSPVALARRLVCRNRASSRCRIVIGRSGVKNAGVKNAGVKD
ncbi:MAG: hypothetical protein ABIP55_00705 [Tepidisphaeraceae bacterium]